MSQHAEVIQTSVLQVGYADDRTLCLQVIGGSQLAVAPSYQISWGSTPWNSAGIWDGLSFRKQFEKAFQVSCCNADHQLVVST